VTREYNVDGIVFSDTCEWTDLGGRASEPRGVAAAIVERDGDGE
jgi:hypothetical protein